MATKEKVSKQEGEGNNSKHCDIDVHLLLAQSQVHKHLHLPIVWWMYNVVEIGHRKIQKVLSSFVHITKVLKN